MRSDNILLFAQKSYPEKNELLDSDKKLSTCVLCIAMPLVQQFACQNKFMNSMYKFCFRNFKIS